MDIQTGLRGSVQAQYRTVNGKTYGPYYFRFWRERGRLRKEYVARDQVDAIRSACERYRSLTSPPDSYFIMFGRVFGYLHKVHSGIKVSKRDRDRLERAAIRCGVLSPDWDAG